MEYKFTENNFNEEVLQSKLPVLVDFYADWCGPCKMMGPLVERMAETYEGRIKIGKVNVDECPGLAQQYGVFSIPSFVCIAEGKVVKTQVGAMSSQDLAAICDSLL